MKTRHLSIIVAGLLFGLSTTGWADARLEKQLNLNLQQAAKVNTIAKQYRLEFNAKRQELHKEQRKLRRARLDSDVAGTASQQQITAKLQDELQQIRQQENEAIREVLTDEQRAQFEQILTQRKNAYGSSRDERDLKTEK